MFGIDASNSFVGPHDDSPTTKPKKPKLHKAEKQLHSFLVIEDSGLGHALCNAKVTVKARTALEAAMKATKCPVEMVVDKDPSQKGVWEAFDVVSDKGWSDQTDPAHIAVMEELVAKGHMKKHTTPRVAYSPINQWMVTVIKR